MDRQAASRTELFAVNVAIATGVVLMGVKFAAYLMTGSAAIFADALESIVNVIASAIAARALHLAHTPADEEHPYGHGKAEFVSAGLEGGMLCVAAGAAVVSACEMMWTAHHPLQFIGLGLVLIGITITANAAVGLWLMRLGAKSGSMTLEADGKHLLADAASSGAAIVSLLVVKLTGWTYADPLAAILISAWVGWTGFRLVQRSLGGLMDKQDAADHRLLVHVLDSHVGTGGKPPRICSYHKLRHRHVGRYHWVDFHIRVPASFDVRRAHDAASAIEEEIESALIEGNATAHVEPCSIEDCPVCAAETSEQPPSLTTH